MQNLKPCPFRQVDDEGHILCDKIKVGDREVTPNLCRACPIAAINCTHLRAILDNQVRPPIVVRYGNGKTEVWEDQAATVTLHRAACAVRVTPILSVHDCAGCPLRQAVIAPDAIAAPALATMAITMGEQRASRRPARRPVAPAPLPQVAMAQNFLAPPAALAPAPGQPAVNLASAGPAVVDPAVEQRRSNLVAQKVIKLQEWLDRQKGPDTEERPAVRTSGHVSARTPARIPSASRLEEKRVGWTD